MDFRILLHNEARECFKVSLKMWLFPFIRRERIGLFYQTKIFHKLRYEIFIFHCRWRTGFLDYSSALRRGTGWLAIHFPEGCQAATCSRTIWKEVMAICWEQPCNLLLSTSVSLDSSVIRSWEMKGKHEEADRTGASSVAHVTLPCSLGCTCSCPSRTSWVSPSLTFQGRASEGASFSPFPSTAGKTGALLSSFSRTFSRLLGKNLTMYSFLAWWFQEGRS